MKKKKFNSYIIAIFIWCSLVAGVFIIATNFQIAKMSGDSMEPTIQDTDWLIMKRGQSVSAFDIVIFSDKESNMYVKRIIGIPGDTVNSVNGSLLINGKNIREDYLSTERNASLELDFQFSQVIQNTPIYYNYTEKQINEITEIPADMYLVLGDNRNNSVDSRHIGLISKKDIQGIIKWYF